MMAGLHDMMVVFRLDLASKLALAVLAGGAIGVERQISGKPAGLRTNILICLGSTLLMELSIGIGMVHGGAPMGDPGRIAAQVVTGIGFLGAGTIMQARGTITGLTSAATIWVVAAIGMTIGAGMYVEALGATAMVMLVLSGLGHLEHSLLRVNRTMRGTVRTRPGIELEWLRATLYGDGIRISNAEIFDHAEDRVFELKLRGPSRQFEIARASLHDHQEVLNVFFE